MKRLRDVGLCACGFILGIFWASHFDGKLVAEALKRMKEAEQRVVVLTNRCIFVPVKDSNGMPLDSDNGRTSPGKDK